jgi:hypothetical protein
MGGVFIGNLGPGNGWGVATWDFVWDSCHACAHHREVRLYAWSSERKRFASLPTNVLVSAQAYEDSTPALAELGLSYSNLLATIPEFQGF